MKAGIGPGTRYGWRGALAFPGDFFDVPTGAIVGTAALSLGATGTLTNATPPTTLDFGNSGTIGPNQFPCSTDRAYGNLFNLSTGGTLSSARVGFQTATAAGGNVKVLVYTDGGSNTPGTLVAASAGVAITGPGWHTVTFADEAITAGDYFLIAVTDGGAFGAYFAQTTPWAGSDAVMNNGGTSYASPPGTWAGNSATYDQVLSIDATINIVTPGAMIGNCTLGLGASGTLVNVGGGMVGTSALALAISGTLTNATPPTTDNFGDENLYSDSLPTSVGRMLGKQFTADASGTLVSMTVGFTAASAGTFNVKALIYSDTANAPVTLLGASDVAVHTTAIGWVTLTFTGGPSIVSGTKYWLFGMTDDNGGLGRRAHDASGSDAVNPEAYMAQPGSFSFASPPSTMPAATATYPYHVSIYATVQTAVSGAMIGTAGLNLGASGTLAGAGALVGNAALALTPAGTLAGAGALAGTVPMVITPSLVRGANGALVGSSALSLAATATLEGAGALVGNSALSMSLSGEVAPTTDIEGSVVLALGASGTLTGVGAMVGNCSLAIANAGTLAGAGALAGNAALALAPSGTLSAQIQISGNAALALTPAGTLAGAGALAGAVGLVLTPSGAATAGVGIVGSTSLTFAASGTLSGTGALAGAVPLSLAPAGTLAGSGALVGNVGLSISLVGSGLANGELPFVGEVELSLGASGTLSGAGALVGNAGLSLGASATISQIVNIAGNASMSMTNQGTGSLLGFMNGNVSIAMAMTAVLLGRGSLIGDVPLRIVLRATPEGYVPAVPPGNIIVWKDPPIPTIRLVEPPIPTIVLKEDEPSPTVLGGPVANKPIVWEDAP